MVTQPSTSRIRYAVAVFALVASACEKSPAAPQNAAPTVSVAFEGGSSCTPRPGAPCTLSVFAIARDPDGDPLRYRWSGCASGDAVRATCTVERSGPVTASLEVSDNHGHAVSASATGEGAALPNSPPLLTVAFAGPSKCIQDGSAPCFLTVQAQASDPDDDPLTYTWSGCATGGSPQATCTVSHVGSVVARLDVSDGHEHTVTATLSGEGIPRPNAPPTVVVTFQGPSACTPLPRKPCTLDVLAEAADPDGDPIRYAWSGCASGTSARATCIVTQPGRVTASVEVSDDHNASGHGVTVGQGSNRPPDVQIGYITLYPSGTIEILGNVSDPDEGFLCGREYCAAVTASGVCASAALQCTCLAGLEASVHRTAPSGICTVTFSLKDSWEEVGTPSISFDVSNPTIWWREPRD